MALLEWASDARQDVDDIYDFIGRLKQRPSIADKFVRQLHQHCQRHADLAAAGNVIGTERPDLGENFRVFSHKRWVVVFRPIEAGIEVMRVVDGSRDFPRLFE